jgi:hypothetical protein
VRERHVNARVFDSVRVGIVRRRHRQQFLLGSTNVIETVGIDLVRSRPIAPHHHEQTTDERDAERNETTTTAIRASTRVASTRSHSSVVTK